MKVLKWMRFELWWLWLKMTRRYHTCPTCYVDLRLEGCECVVCVLCHRQVFEFDAMGAGSDALCLQCCGIEPCFGVAV